MIKIILPSGLVTCQLQLEDFPKWKKTYTFKFEAIPKAGIARTILRYFRQRLALKKGGKSPRKVPPQPSHSLFEYLSKGHGTAGGPARDNATKAKSTKAKLCLPRYKQVTLPDYAASRRTYLKEVRTKFIDRVPPVPSVTCEDFCTGANLEKEWAFYQEVPEFRGLFQHLVLLNSFSYWDGVEAALRKEGFHPSLDVYVWTSIDTSQNH